MESKTYQEEMKQLLIREIPRHEAVEIAKRLYHDGRVKDRIGRLGHALDECVMVYVGMTGSEDVDADDFIAFLDSVLGVVLEIAEDAALRTRYQELQPVDRATPIQDLWEIASLILLAVTSGVASGVAATLVRSFLSRDKKERADLLVKFVLRSPLPALLTKSPDGLSTEELTAGASLPESTILVDLGRFEARGWVEKREREGKVVWRLKERKLLKDLGK